MIAGIGTDIVDLARLDQAFARHGERLAFRILGAQELEPFYACSGQAAFLARRFAAKEAAAKALGTGLCHGITLRDLEVTHDGWGKPGLNLHGGAGERAAWLNVARAELSLSDERDYAVAFVVLLQATAMGGAS